MGSFVFGCSGAKDQDVLSNDVGGATTNSSSSGTTTSGGTTSGGTTSGGTTSGGTTSGGTTSGGTTSGGTDGCTQEDGDSTQDNPINFNGCVSGTLTVPGDEEDWASFEMPKNNGMSLNFSGPVALAFYNSEGRQFNLKNIPNNEGQYFIQIQYDFDKNPIPQNPKNPLSAPWQVTLSFKQ